LPRFIDHHATSPNLPPEVISIIRKALRSGQPNEFGQKGINVFIGSQRTFCCNEAPSADAVRRSHAAMGISLGPDDVVEVIALP